MRIVLPEGEVAGRTITDLWMHARSSDDRWVGDQIVRTMFARGITPCERGDRRGVLHTKTATRLERERSLGSCALPREADGRVTVGAVRKGSVERVKLIAELSERIQRLHHRTLQILINLSSGIIVTIDIAAIVGLAQQLHGRKNCTARAAI